MKALAIDSSSQVLTFAALNSDAAYTGGRSSPKTALLSLDIGMRQSEKLLEGIDSVLKHCDLKPEELDYTALCAGPGTFTGLRLAFSALKAIQLAYGTPCYAIPTLEAAAYSYREWDGAVIPVLDAKKQSFYAAVYRYGKLQAGPFDETLDTIIRHIDPEERVLAVGADAAFFAEQVRLSHPQLYIRTNLPFAEESRILNGCSAHTATAALSLIELAGEKFRAKEKPLEEYEGPYYIRKSEAELSLAEQTGEHT